jgi:hypothetical protein
MFGENIENPSSGIRKREITLSITQKDYQWANIRSGGTDGRMIQAIVAINLRTKVHTIAALNLRAGTLRHFKVIRERCVSAPVLQ